MQRRTGQQPLRSGHGRSEGSLAQDAAAAEEEEPALGPPQLTERAASSRPTASRADPEAATVGRPTDAPTGTPARAAPRELAGSASRSHAHKLAQDTRLLIVSGNAALQTEATTWGHVTSQGEDRLFELHSRALDWSLPRSEHSLPTNDEPLESLHPGHIHRMHAAQLAEAMHTLHC